MDERRDGVGMPGLEADAAAGHVNARDDVVAKGFGTNAGEVVDLGAAMAVAREALTQHWAAGPAQPRRLRPASVFARKPLVEAVGRDRALAKQTSRPWQTHNGRNNEPVPHE